MEGDVAVDGMGEGRMEADVVVDGISVGRMEADVVVGMGGGFLISLDFRGNISGVI